MQLLDDRIVPAFGFGSAMGFGGAGADYGIGIAFDASGNYYVSGMYSGTVDFDPNHTNPSSNHVLTASGDYANYAAKFLANGTFAWAADLGPIAQGYPAETISVQGNSVFVGYPTATAGGTDNVATVARVDAATGVVTWSTTLTSGGTTGMGVGAGPSGSVYVTGNNSSSQAFVSRLDAAGNVLWTTTNTGSGTAYGSRLIVDSAGNVFATGAYTGTVTFGATVKTSISGSQDGFIWKLNSSGGVVWAGSIGSNGLDYVKGICLDGSGNVFVTGGWGAGSGTASQNNNFNPNSGSAVKLTNHGDSDIYVAKFVPAANGGLNLSWAKDIGGYSTDWGQRVVTDAAGNVYSTGLFSGTVNFNPNNGKPQNLSGGGVFVSKLTSAGNYADSAGMGSGTGNGRAIALDSGGNVYVTGVFYGTGDFNPTAGTYNLTANGSVDAFVVKLTPGNASKALKAVTQPLLDEIDWLLTGQALKPKHSAYVEWLN